MSDEQILTEPEEIQVEPVIDEFTLSKLAEAAEYEDQLQRSKDALKQRQAEADDRERVQADARFAEARARFPNLTVHQVADLLDDNHL